MAYNFTGTAGVTMERELLIAYLNTGTSSSPTWSALGARVEDSSQEYDWQDETITDVLGIKRNTLKKPTITQTFDPSKLDSGEAALKAIWDLAVKDQDISALAAQDMLIVHFYAFSTQNTPNYLQIFRLSRRVVVNYQSKTIRKRNCLVCTVISIQIFRFI